eukprot:7390761-Pyramimonas_sp.AAC.1
MYIHAYIRWAGMRAQRWHCAVPLDSVFLGSRLGPWCVHSAPGRPIPPQGRKWRRRTTSSVRTEVDTGSDFFDVDRLG